MCAYNRTYGLPAMITNCSNNYGPYQFPEKLIPLMIINALEGKPLPIYGKGENIRDWLYGEAPLPGITSAALATRISELNTAPPVTQNDNITVLEETIAATARPGDLIITMGAGDINCFAPRNIMLLEEK